MIRLIEAFAERHSNLTRKVLTRVKAFRTKRLIVFLTPGYDWRAGGIMTIASFYRESMALQHIHRAKVALCVLPGDPLLLKYSWFENRDYMLELEAVLKSCGPLDYLQIHMPAMGVNQVVDWLNSAAPRLLQNVREVHLNILVQNIDNMQGKNVLGLAQFGKVTATTAFESNANLATREALGVPLHRLSTCNGPERYQLSGYEEKESLMIVSPDAHPWKERVLGHIGTNFPELRIQIIHDMSYEDYRKLICRAKWSLTFGEGLDGYFMEPALSGAVPFAVFNDRFFTPAFANLETVYRSWEVLMGRITTDLRRLDEPVAYTNCWRGPYDLLSELYDTSRFRENLSKFYRGEYTFP